MLLIIEMFKKYQPELKILINKQANKFKINKLFYKIKIT